jgi:hypothetical protein
LNESPKLHFRFFEYILYSDEDRTLVGYVVYDVSTILNHTYSFTQCTIWKEVHYTSLPFQTYLAMSLATSGTVCCRTVLITESAACDFEFHCRYARNLHLFCWNTNYKWSSNQQKALSGGISFSTQAGKSIKFCWIVITCGFYRPCVRSHH